MRTGIRLQWPFGALVLLPSLEKRLTEVMGRPEALAAALSLRNDVEPLRRLDHDELVIEVRNGFARQESCYSCADGSADGNRNGGCI